MFGNWKFLTVLVVSSLVAIGSAQALSVHAGADSNASGVTTNSDGAYADWLAEVSSSTPDDMTGIANGASCVGGCTTVVGNTFTQGTGTLSGSNFTQGVVSGPNILLIQRNTEGNFTWTLPVAANANAFGFFAFDTDGETITINFDDGTAQELTFATGLGTSDSLFWGVTGLAQNITSVTISALDSPGYSTWDRFVFGVTVPIPAALPLFLSGLAFFGFVARRRAGAATA